MLQTLADEGMTVEALDGGIYSTHEEKLTSWSEATLKFLWRSNHLYNQVRRWRLAFGCSFLFCVKVLHTTL